MREVFTMAAEGKNNEFHQNNFASNVVTNKLNETVLIYSQSCDPSVARGVAALVSSKKTVLSKLNR